MKALAIYPQSNLPIASKAKWEIRKTGKSPFTPQGKPCRLRLFTACLKGKMGN
jgi:hypothetical protein